MTSLRSSAALSVLVVGGGGREHALAWACGRSPLVSRVACAPGNGGTLRIGENHQLSVTDGPAIVRLATEGGFDLVLLGPDSAGAAGVGDQLEAAGVRYFGPTRAAARLESSKSFAKELLVEAGIRTAEAQLFDDPARALEHVRGMREPLVVKADGLALGKGVLICQDGPDAERAVRRLMIDQEMGEAGRRVVIEQLLEGEEVSFFALCDGERALMLPSARDYKRSDDGDLGANTGGMGGYSLGEAELPGMAERVRSEVVLPTLEAMRRMGSPFRGCLYVGAMICDGDPYVLEFNARFGDPETEILLPLLQDLVPHLFEVAEGRLQSLPPVATGSAVGVVAAQAPYPQGPGPGGAIEGIEAAEAEGCLVFHMGTRDSAGRLEVSGGRVLICVGRGEDRTSARALAYQGMEQIHFPVMRYRRDIAPG